MSARGPSPRRPRGGEPPTSLTRVDRLRSRQWFVGGAAAVVVVALFLRFYDLGSQSFWIDEISVTSFLKSGHLLSDLRDRGGPFEPPLHYLTVLAALQLPFGFETAARVPSAIFGALEVLALILLTWEATRRQVTALVAGLLLAVAPFVLRYSQENRYYVMFSALALLSWWLLLRALRLRSTGPWVWYGVVAAAMQLTHPFAPLVLIVQALGVAYVWWRERRKQEARSLRGYWVAVAVGFVLILPWYVYGAFEWIPALIDGKSYALNTPGQFQVPIESDLFTRAATWLLGNASRFTALVVVLLVLALAAPLLARGRSRVVASCALAYTLGFMLALVPLARALGTYFAYRRVESLVAPMLLAVAIALVAVADRLEQLHVSRRIAIALGGLTIAVVVGTSIGASISYYRSEKTNYRGLAAVVRDAPADDLIVIGPTTARTARYIRGYLDWQGVHRPVRFLVPDHLPDDPATVPTSVTWLTGSPPGRPDMTSRSLNDLSKLQVIAGDRSGLLVVLPWYASTSHPTSMQEFLDQQDATVRLGPYLSVRQDT